MQLESYEAFAYAYDQALGIRFFRAIRPVLARLERRYPPAEKRHLDVACGTGLVVEHFQSQGWRSVGIDASLTMLRIASSRARDLVAGDFHALPLRRRFSWITCLYDSLNHVKLRNELVRVFRSIRHVMDDESLFVFDVNHPDVYRESWALADPFVSDGPGHHLEIATSFRERDAIGRAVVTGWALRRGRRIAIAERREQRAWRPDQIEAALTAAGLTPLEVLDFNPFRGTRSRRWKLVYVTSLRRETAREEERRQSRR